MPDQSPRNQITTISLPYSREDGLDMVEALRVVNEQGVQSKRTNPNSDDGLQMNYLQKNTRLVYDVIDLGRKFYPPMTPAERERYLIENPAIRRGQEYEQEIALRDLYEQKHNLSTKTENGQINILKQWINYQMPLFLSSEADPCTAGTYLTTGEHAIPITFQRRGNKVEILAYNTMPGNKFYTECINVVMEEMKENISRKGMDCTYSSVKNILQNDGVSCAVAAIRVLMCLDETETLREQEPFITAKIKETLSSDKGKMATRQKHLIVFDAAAALGMTSQVIGPYKRFSVLTDEEKIKINELRSNPNVQDLLPQSKRQPSFSNEKNDVKAPVAQPPVPAPVTSSRREKNLLKRPNSTSPQPRNPNNLFTRGQPKEIAIKIVEINTGTEEEDYAAFKEILEKGLGFPVLRPELDVNKVLHSYGTIEEKRKFSKQYFDQQRELFGQGKLDPAGQPIEKSESSSSLSRSVGYGR